MKFVVFVFATALIVLQVVLHLPLIGAASGVAVDVFTLRGGRGLGEPSGPFKVGEMVRLYAELTENGMPVADACLNFEVYAPSDPNTSIAWLSGVTNASGIGAASPFRIGSMDMPGWEEKLLGTWKVVAFGGMSGQVSTDVLTFECDWDLVADFFIPKAGVDHGGFTEYEPFRAGEAVTLYGRVTNRTVPAPDMPMDFMVYEYEHLINFSQYTHYAAFTNQSGLGWVSFRLPWRIESNYSIYCQCFMMYGEYLFRDDMGFDCLAGERIVGDINYDMKVDITDIAICSRSFGSYATHGRWNPECDLNDDGRVDIRDIAQASASFGRTS